MCNWFCREDRWQVELVRLVYTRVLGEKHDPAQLALGYKSGLYLVPSSVSDLKHHCHRQILSLFMLHFS